MLYGSSEREHQEAKPNFQGTTTTKSFNNRPNKSPRTTPSKSRNTPLPRNRTLAPAPPPRTARTSRDPQTITATHLQILALHECDATARCAVQVRRGRGSSGEFDGLSAAIVR